MIDVATKHPIYDADTHFTIDPVSRVMTNEAPQRTNLIQGDHNSERFTFELPRIIEGHDMSQCDSVQVHYINIDSQNKEQQSTGIYDVEDMEVSPDDENAIVCSWLISQKATKYIGSLNFVLRFACVNGDGSLSYAWHSAVFSQISVSKGINNSDEIVEDYFDILAQWAARFDEMEQGAGHTHSNKAVLDKFGINKANTRPTFGGTSQSNALALIDDVNQSVGYLRQDLQEQIALIPKFSISVVDTLPTTDINYSALYLLRDTEASGNSYTEYIYVRGVWEKLGTQSFDVDLSEYYTKQEIDKKGFITADQLPSGGDGIVVETDPTVPAWAKEPEKPTYTAEEVGALPVGTVIPTTEELVNAVIEALPKYEGEVSEV